MVLLALPPADHLLNERDRGQFVPSRRRRVMANVRAERLLKIPAEPSPELRIRRVGEDVAPSPPTDPDVQNYCIRFFTREFG
jgi:hypothetical protein